MSIIDQNMTGSPRINADWFTAFASQLRTVQAIRQFGGSVELMLLGDPITFNMQWSACFNQLMAGKRTLNFGVGGDETANLLWRINHGLLDGISPRLITVMVGINDLWYRSEPDVIQVAARILHIRRRIRQLSPQSKLPHLAILPTGGYAAGHNMLITRVNDLLNETHCDEAVTYQNLTGHYLDTSDQVTGALQTDGVHLSEAGYEIVAAGIKPFISL